MSSQPPRHGRRSRGIFSTKQPYANLPEGEEQELKDLPADHARREQQEKNTEPGNLPHHDPKHPLRGGVQEHDSDELDDPADRPGGNDEGYGAARRDFRRHAKGAGMLLSTPTSLLRCALIRFTHCVYFTYVDLPFLTAGFYVNKFIHAFQFTNHSSLHRTTQMESHRNLPRRWYRRAPNLLRNSRNRCTVPISSTV